METSAESRVRTITSVFDEYRAAGKSYEEIFVAAYNELKQLARKMTSGVPAGASMRATVLLSDLWVHLFGKEAHFTWDMGKDFFSAMATAMHRLLIDHARKKGALRRGGAFQVRSLDEAGFGDGAAEGRGRRFNFEEAAIRSLDLEAALEWLEHRWDDNPERAKLAARQAEIVRLLMFDGLSEEETGKLLNRGPETVKKEWRKARAALNSYLEGQAAGAE
jgi:RNA polymerase sigma factor (TIGR02999 family)